MNTKMLNERTDEQKLNRNDEHKIMFKIDDEKRWFTKIMSFQKVWLKIQNKYIESISVEIFLNVI